jgi:hypothetical protein
MPLPAAIRNREEVVQDTGVASRALVLPSDDDDDVTKPVPPPGGALLPAPATSSTYSSSSDLKIHGPCNGGGVASSSDETVTLDTASITVDDWTSVGTTASAAANSSRGYYTTTRRGSVTSNSRRSSLTSALSGSRRGSLQSSICSFDTMMSRRGSTASEVSNDDGTAVCSVATGTTTASTRRRRLLFGLVTTVEFDKHKPANERLNQQATVSHPTEARWDSTPVSKRKILSTRRRKSQGHGQSSSGAKAAASWRRSRSHDDDDYNYDDDDDDYDNDNYAPAIPSRSSSYPAPSTDNHNNRSIVRGGEHRRSSIEIKRPRRRQSIEEFAAHRAASSSSSASALNFLIPLEITSSAAAARAQPSELPSTHKEPRRGSWVSRAMPNLPRRRGSIELPPQPPAMSAAAAAAATRRASIEMPIVFEEDSDDLEMSGPFAVPTGKNQVQSGTAAALDEAAGEVLDESSSSSCLTDSSSSSRNNAKADLDLIDPQIIVLQEDNDSEFDSSETQDADFHVKAGAPTGATTATTPSPYDALFADESAEIVTSVPFSGAASSRRRLSLLEKVHHRPPQAKVPIDAPPVRPPRRQSSGAGGRRGSFLTNLFATLSFSSSSGSSSSDDNNARDTTEERAAQTRRSSSNTAHASPDGSPASADASGRRRSLLRASLSPRQPHRTPSDDSSPSESESPPTTAVADPTTDRPCRQPARRSSLLSLLHSLSTRIEDDVGNEVDRVGENPFSSATDATAASSPLPKQPRRRPSHQAAHAPTSKTGTATRRSSWQLLAIEKPHKSESDVPTEKMLALPESPPRAVSEPSRRGSLLGMLLFFRTSMEDDASLHPTDDTQGFVEPDLQRHSMASSTDESDEEPAEGKDGAKYVTCEPRRRDGIKPSPFLRRYASCEGRFETTDGASSALADATGEPVSDEDDRRRSSMVITLPSRKLTLQPNHPMYRVRDNGQQATITPGDNSSSKSRGGRRRWSLISNLPGRRSVTGATSTDDADIIADATVGAAATPGPGVGSRSCSDSALLVAR